MFSQIGQVLSRTRERRGLSLSEVQTQTNIRLRYLEAMEAGDFSVIPGEVYARGFLRTYARFLQLEDEELMRMYAEACQGASQSDAAAAVAATATASAAPSARVAKPRRPKPQRASGDGGTPIFRPQRAPRAILPAILLVAVAGAVAVGLYYLGTGIGLPAEGPPVDPEPPLVAEPEPEPPPPPPDPEPPALSVAKQPPDPQVPNYVTYVAANATGPVEVVVRTGMNCWYRATVDGNVVGEGTLRAGEELVLTAETTVHVHLGNPQDITVTVGGEYTDHISAQQPRHVVVQAEPLP